MRKILSQRLRELRESMGLSQKALSEKISVSAASIGYYENGDRIPGLDVAAELANFFGVSLDYLAGRSDSRTHEAADISARTGLSEAAVEVLEAIHDMQNALGPLQVEPKHSTILSEIIETAAPAMSFDEYMMNRAHGIQVVTSDEGEELGTLCYLWDGDIPKISFFPYDALDGGLPHPENVRVRTGVEIMDFDTSEILPKSFRRKMREKYEAYTALSHRCRSSASILDILFKFYGNAHTSTAKLMYSRPLNFGIVTGDHSADLLYKDPDKVGVLRKIFETSSEDVTVLPIASLLDEVTLRELGDALRTMRELHKKTEQEAADAQEE